MEHFGFDEESSRLAFNGEKDWRKEEEWEEELLEKEECKVAMKNIAQRHKAFEERLKSLSIIKDIRQTGTIIAIELKADSSGYASTIRQQLYQYFLSQGVLLRPLGNVIYILPPYCITELELAKVYEVIETKLQTLNNAINIGFIVQLKYKK
jgi:adenosylmethionine-8-amino-7-oxononanoate aminotransferase